MRRWMVLVIMMGFLVSPGRAEAEINLRGLAQAWLSYADVTNEFGYELGFNVQRVRINPYGRFGSRWEWGVEAGWDEGNARLLDAWLRYRLNDSLALRIGQFAVPGARSGGLTWSGDLDFVERAAVTSKWGDYNRLLDFRAMGVQVEGRMMNDRVHYAFMLANPRTLQVFSPSIKDPFPFNTTNYGFCAWGNLRVTPVDGLDFGAFYGYAAEDDTGAKRSSYGAHLYFLFAPWKAKLEYIAGENEFSSGTTPYDGVYAVLGYELGRIELLVRYGFYTPIEDSVSKDGVKKFNNTTLGMNYKANENVRFQVNYVIRDEIMAQGFRAYSNNIFYLCCQYTF
ncbi:MAG: porin [Acidobacteriota bacterium]|jgi:phosphate-selective porin|nr:porin [Acidobacteriota bacterium]